MKKHLYFTISILLTMSMSMSAQNLNNRRNFDNRRSDQSYRMTPKEKVDLMTKELDLTAKEAAQILTLAEKQEVKRLEQIREHRDKRGTGQANREVRREEMWDLRKEEVEKHDAELEKIIGKQKVERWNDIRQDVRDYNRSGRMSGRGGHGRRGYYRNNQRSNNNRRNFDNRRNDYTMRMTLQERIDMMTNELNLNSNQSAQVKVLMERQDAKRLEQIKEHRDQRGTGQINRDVRRGEMWDLRKEEVEKHDAELEKIIGKDNVDKWNEICREVRETNQGGRRDGRGNSRRNNRNW